MPNSKSPAHQCSLEIPSGLIFLEQSELTSIVSEEWDVSLDELAHKYLVRPFQMLMTPICLFVALYASFVYGILYANLAAFPIAYQEVRGWNLVVGSLPFLSMLLGIFTGGVPTILNQKYYFKRMQKNDGKAVPEARLPPMMFGAVTFSAGLLIFAWTSSPHIHWFPSQVGCFLIGQCFRLILHIFVGRCAPLTRLRPRLLRHLPGGPQLPRGYIYTIWSICHRCKHFPTVYVRCRLSSFHGSHAP